jgi:uncharacterized protein
VADRMGLVLDTNVFVAAGFRPRSHCARLLADVQCGIRAMVWNRPTRRETRAVLTRIPRLDWARFAPLFAPDAEFAGLTRPEDFPVVEDPADRKFIALAAAAGVCLVSSDRHLLSVRGRVEVEILTPSEAWRLR